MNFGKLKYRSLLLGAGMSMLLATSCKDFLDVDIQDQYSESSLSSKQAFDALTIPLYGGMRWSQYEGKFAWCVNEGVSGVLFNVNDQEGALFRLSIGEDNSILKEGYQSLYSGVIANCNQVISTIERAKKNGLPSGMTESDADAIAAEAYLFRGYAHFMATEYFGEVPLVWNTEKDMSENVTLPRVSRRTVYAGVMHDLNIAYDKLPAEINPLAPWRATKYSAAALLTKLYLTMSSCRTQTPGLSYPYVCEDVEGYLRKALAFANEVIGSNKFSLVPHDNMFAAENRNVPSPETILALYWKMDSYGSGSAYQAQMAPSSDWSPGSGWGSGKGLTYTLYNSFSDDDARKKELCFFVGTDKGQGYTTADGKRAWYGSDYTSKKKAGEADFGSTGKEFLSSGQRVMNNIKKYVWGVNGTAVHGSGMSTDRRQDIIRLSDVYMMRAEIKLALNGFGDTLVCKDEVILKDVNDVLEKHNANEKLDSLRFFEDFSSKHPAHQKFTFTVTVDDGNGGSTSKQVELEAGQLANGIYQNGMYHQDKRTDLIQQRRKEFAMEGIAWLDLKRLYYRNPALAEKYLYQMDRGVQFANSPVFPEGDSRFENEKGYERLALVNGCNAKLKEEFPDGGYTVGDPEVEIFNQTFIDRCRWYLPIPTSAKSFLRANVEDLYDQVINGSYPY